MKKIIVLGLFIIFAVSTTFLTGCGFNNNPKLIFVEEVTLDVEKIVMLQGDTHQINATVYPSNATNKNLEFSIHDTNIASVDRRGRITASRQGSTYIVISSKDGSVRNAVAEISVYQETRPMLSPQDIIINQIGEKDKYILEWTGSDRALGYIININGVDGPTTTIPRYNISDYKGINTFKVSAVGDGKVLLNSNYSSEIEFASLDVPANINNEGSLITWDSVEGSNGYKLNINGKIVETENNEYALDNIVPGQENIISVSAKTNRVGPYLYDSLFSSSIKVKKLEEVDNLKMVNGAFTWDTVRDASEYEVSINNTRHTVYANVFDTRKKTDLENFSFSVIAINKDDKGLIDSDESMTIDVSRLISPNNLRLDSGIIKWDETLHAGGYIVKINGTEVQTKDTSFTISSIYTGLVFDISVKALGNDNNNLISSNFTEILGAQKLLYPSSVYVEEGILRWSPVNNASGYILSFNNEERLVESNYFEDKLNEDNIPLEPGEYNVRVKAIGEDFLYSEYSNNMYIRKLSPASDLRINNGAIRWDAVAGAGSYEIMMNDKVIDLGRSTSYNAINELSKTYNVTVRVMGDNTRNLNSDLSHSITAIKPEKPGNITVDDFGILNISDYSQNFPDHNNIEYEFRFNDEVIRFEEYSDVSQIINLKTSGPQKVRYFVVGDSEKYLNSPFSEKLYINKLENINAHISNNNLYFDWVPSATMHQVIIYKVIIDEGNEMYEEYFTYSLEDNQSILDLTDLPEDIYRIIIFAVGDKNNMVSNIESNIYTTRLGSPTNINIENGQVYWDAVEYADEYIVEIKNLQNNVTSEYYTKLDTYILHDKYGPGDYEVRVMSIGGESNKIRSSFSDPKKISRLDAPTGMEVKNGYLTWDQVSRIIEDNNGNDTIYANSYRVTIGNQVFTVDAPESSEDSVVMKIRPRITAGQHNVTIEAIIEEGYAYSLKSQEFLIRSLDRVVGVHVGNEIIHWDYAQYSSGYTVRMIHDQDFKEIYIDDVTIVQIPVSEMLNSFGFSIETFNQDNSDFVIEVYAHGDDIDVLNSAQSNSFTTSILRAPEGIRVSEGGITWNNVENAIKYFIKINGAKYELNDQTEYSLGNEFDHGEYDISVRAYGDGSRYINSIFSDEITAHKLESPNIRLENGFVVFDEISNSPGYRAKVLSGDDDEDFYPEFGEVFTSNIYELSDDNKVRNDDEKKIIYSIILKAIGDSNMYLTSNESNIITGERIDNVQEIRVENGEIFWDAIPSGSNGYYVKYGSTIIDNKNSRSFNLAETLDEDLVESQYEIFIKAQGNDSDRFSSKFTEPFRVSQPGKVLNIRAQDGIILWDDPFYVGDKGFLAIVTNELNETEEFTISKGQEINLDGLEPGVFTIELKVLGDASSSDNNTPILLSLFSEKFEFTKLEEPKNFNLEYTSDDDHILLWDPVEAASKYRIYILDKNNDLTVDKNNSIIEYIEVIYGQEKINLTELYGSDFSGVYKISISSIVEGNIPVINSNFSDEYIVTRPETPLNLRVEGAKFVWDESEFADSYRVIISMNQDQEGSQGGEGVINIERIVTTNYCYIFDIGDDRTVTVSAMFGASLESDRSSSITYSFNMFNLGDGSESDPFEITTREHFINIVYNPTAYYILNPKDINGNSIDYLDFNGVDNFIPFGSESSKFIGNFDGQGYEIKNLNIGEGSDHIGIFGYIGSSGSVKNLSIININISSTNNYVGAIAGYNEGNIESIYVSGNIIPTINDNSQSIYAGGVVGVNIGYISNAMSNITVFPGGTSIHYVGGISGKNSGTIKKSGNLSGSIIQGAFAGGISGFNEGQIDQTYNKGSITSKAVHDNDSVNAFGGGIVGYNTLTLGIINSGIIKNSYNLGSVHSITESSSLLAYASGIVGFNDLGEDQDNQNIAHITHTYNFGEITVDFPINGAGRVSHIANLPSTQGLALQSVEYSIGYSLRNINILNSSSGETTDGVSTNAIYDLNDLMKAGTVDALNSLDDAKDVWYNDPENIPSLLFEHEE